MGFAFKKGRDTAKELVSGGKPAFAGLVGKYHDNGGGVGAAKSAAGAARKVRKGVAERSLLDVN
jgi:hypothetical protein